MYSAIVVLLIIALVMLSGSFEYFTLEILFFLIPGFLLFRRRMMFLERLNIVVVLSVIFTIFYALPVFSMFGYSIVFDIFFIILLILIALKSEIDRSDMKFLLISLLIFASVFLASHMLFEDNGILSNRILLGQLDTVDQIVEIGRFPDKSLEFSTYIDFPMYYFSYDSFFGYIMSFAGIHKYEDMEKLYVYLRLLILLFFLLSAYNFYNCLLSTAFGKKIYSAGFIFVSLLLFSRFLKYKTSDVLTETFGLIFFFTCGYLFLKYRETGDGIFLYINLLCMLVLFGINLAPFISSFMMVASFIIYNIEDVLRDIANKKFYKALLDKQGILLLSPIFGLFLLFIASKSLPFLKIAKMSIEHEKKEEIMHGVINAYQLISSNEKIGEASLSSLAKTYLDINYVFVPFSSGNVVYLLILIGATFLLFYYTKQKINLKYAASFFLIFPLITILYSYSGLILGKDALTPWITLMRNSYYIWFGFAGLAAFGLYNMFCTLIRNKSLRIPAIILISVILFADVYAVVMERYDVMGTHAYQMKPNGRQALLWLCENTDEKDKIMLPEITYGGKVLCRRDIITDGKGMLNNIPFMLHTYSLMLDVKRFYLYQDPTVLLKYDVDYVFSYRNNLYWYGIFGGVPVLRAHKDMGYNVYRKLSEIEFLENVERIGKINVFRVKREIINEKYTRYEVNTSAEIQWDGKSYLYIYSSEKPRLESSKKLSYKIFMDVFPENYVIIVEPDNKGKRKIEVVL